MDTSAIGAALCGAGRWLPAATLFKCGYSICIASCGRARDAHNLPSIAVGDCAAIGNIVR